MFLLRVGGEREARQSWWAAHALLGQFLGNSGLLGPSHTKRFIAGMTVIITVVVVVVLTPCRLKKGQRWLKS